MSVATVQSTAEGDGTVIVIVVVAVLVAGSPRVVTPRADVAYCWNTCIVHVPTCASVVGKILAV